METKQSTKLLAEYEKYQELQQKTKKMQEDYEAMLDKHEKDKQQVKICGMR